MIATVMTQEISFCRASDALQNIWSHMKDNDFQDIPAINHDHRPVGVLNARAALQALLGEVACEESLLRDYVMCVGYR